MSLLETSDARESDPLDGIERIASRHEWTYERVSDEEITLITAGEWGDLRVSFTWMADIEALHVGCAFDMRVPEPRRSEVERLVARINEQLWLGHFDVWFNTGLVMYRHSLMLNGGSIASPSQCEAILAAAVEACERYYPAFQFVVWAGQSASDAMAAVMFETAGEA